MNLDPLLSPESVAVVGASRTEKKIGHILLSNLIEGGFQGTIIPITSGEDELLGLPCFPSLTDYGKDIDLVIIVLPIEQVKAIVDECGKLRVKAVLVTDAEFRESEPERATLERQVIDLCHRHDIVLLGPNSLGCINTAENLNASFAGEIPDSGGMSVFSQSEALSRVMLDLSIDRNLGIAKFINISTKADITSVDILTHLAKDKKTKVIIGYLKNIVAGNKFVKAAEEAASQKPVIIMKSGTTAAGIKATTSHTGLLASLDTAYGAVFKRSGVIRADTFEALFDFASAFSMQPLPKGNRIFVITNAGGPGILAADAIEQAGMKVAEPDYSSKKLLNTHMPQSAGGSNPIHILGNANPDQYAALLKEAQADCSVDAILVILSPQAMSRPAEIIKAIATSADATKPVLAVFMSGDNLLPSNSELAAAGLPNYESPERAVAAFKRMLEYATWKQRPPRTVTRFRVNRRRVERILSRRQRIGKLQLGEVKGKDVLGAYGFQIPEGALASSAEDATEIAERLGFPVAMKIVSPDILHKNDLGGVFLNVANSESVEDTYDLMMLKIRKKVPDARIEGIYVETMIAKGTEVIIGMTRDPLFGPMLMFGLGGIFVEVMKDVTFHLAPITEQEAIQMLKSTRSYDMLQSRRGQSGIDIAAIASGLQRISQLTTDFPQILELDINPFIVGNFGSEPVVADVQMTLAPLPEEK